MKDRSHWQTEKFDATGDWDESSPSQSLTGHQRLNYAWPMIKSIWKLTHGTVPGRELPRHALPVERRKG